MNRIEAFSELIEQRNWYKKMGISPKTATTHKKRFKEGKHVSLDFMGRALESAGYKIVQEEHWEATL